MSELPDLSAQKPYALDQLAQLQGKIIQLSKSMVLQRARIERCRQSDLAAARDIYAELSRTRETLVETLAQVQLFLMEMEEYALAKVSGQLRQGLAGFALMSTGYKSVYEALSRFASSLPVGQKTNAAVVGRLMNNIKLGYYPTDPDNIDLLLRGIKFPEGVTTNLLDPCCGCGKALRQLAQGNNCYAYGVELDESRAEEAQTRLHRVGFGSFFHSSISREAFHLLFLNPPYLSFINESGGRSRHEKRFLIESLPALAYGGNGKYTGQVVCGVRRNGRTIRKSIGGVHPEMLKDTDLFPSEISCAEAAQEDPQSIVANVTAATAVLIMVYNILTHGENNAMQTDFSTQTIRMQTVLEKQTRRRAA